MTDIATASASKRLIAYQSRHTIQMIPLEDLARGYEAYCTVDGIRILPVKGGRWRHDPDHVVKLLDEVHGGTWPSRVVIVEDEDAYVVTVDEDDEWTNREGMPEFNGAFRG